MGKAATVSWYSLPPFAVGLTCLLVGVLVGLKGRPRPANFIYSLLTCSIAIWFIAYALAYSCHDPADALRWVKIAYIGIIFIPITFYHFVVTFLELRRERRWVIASYLLGMMFVLLDFGTDTFVSGLYHYPWGYHTKVGFMHNFYLPLFFGLNLRGFWLLYVASKAPLTEQGPEQINRLGYLFWACVIAFFGSVDFLPHYGIPIYPFGYVFLAAAALITTHAIVRHRLMDINLALTRAAIVAFSYTPLLFLPIAAGVVWQERLASWFGPRWWIWPTLSEALFAMAGLVLYRYLQGKAEARLLREQRRYQTTLMNAAKGMVQVRELSRLLNLVAHLLTRAMRLTHAAVFLADERTGRYLLQAGRGHAALKPGFAFNGGDPLVVWLQTHKEPLIYEETKQWAAQRNGAESLAGVRPGMQRLEASVVIPSFTEDFLIGFLILGDKKSGQMYSQDDLNVLQTLANQAALAIQNAQFFQELQTKTAELIHESKLKSMGKMASGMSHQINNRMACLVAEASSAKEQYLVRLRAASSEAEREAVIRELEAKLDSICEEGIKGGTIVKTLLDFSKPTTKFSMAGLEEIIRGGLKMVGLKHELHKLNVYVHVPKDHPGVRGNVSQLQDVFFNLIDNACDAIHWKATSLTRGTLQVPGSELPYQGQIAVIAKLSEDRAKHLITVADNGLGMTPEDTDRLFLPFHTTKGTAEKGTGLGLFVIREMLKGHRGDIRLEKSEPGRGTTFLIELPVPEEERSWARSSS